MSVKEARKALSLYNKALKRRTKLESQLGQVGKEVLDLADKADDTARWVSLAESAVAEARTAAKRGRKKA
jgi:hypothetical protein